MPPRSAMATGNRHETRTIYGSDASPADHWLTDPRQISRWQGKLVDCCNAINQQLSQIQDDLAVQNTLQPAPASLKLICDVERV